LIARYPVPNDPQGAFGARTYATSSRVKTVTDQFSACIDHNLGEKTKLFFRVSVNNITGPTTNPSQTALDPSFAVEFFDRQRKCRVFHNALTLGDFHLGDFGGFRAQRQTFRQGIIRTRR